MPYINLPYTVGRTAQNHAALSPESHSTEDAE